MLSHTNSKSKRMSKPLTAESGSSSTQPSKSQYGSETTVTSCGTSYQRKGLPVAELTMRQVEELREAFNIFDSEETGYISLADFKIAVKAIGVEHNNREIQDMMEECEVNPKERRCKVSFQEFQNFLTKKMNEIDSDVEAERAFELFDDDDTGAISLRNLRRVARQLGEDIREEELTDMIAAADRRGVGEVCLEDFKRVVLDPNWRCGRK